MPTTSTPWLDADHVRLDRSGRTVLHDISLQIRPGEVIGVVGRNGAGKTSLLETLLGFHRLQSGSVQLWGRPVRQLRGEDKRRIGFVPQQDELLDGLTGWQQIKLISSFYPEWDAALLARLGEDWQLPLARPIRQWSLGQRQKLSIVLALASRPDLLVLDEPVASLDPLARAQFLAEMTALATNPARALVFSSHIVADLAGLVNRLWLVDAGRLHWQGSVADVGRLTGHTGNGPVNLEAAFRQLLA